MRRYIIDEERLIELIAAEAELQCLDHDGVDNWVWYMESKEDFLHDWAENLEMSDYVNLSFESCAREEVRKNYSVF